jgi:hypothetical protein
MMLSRWFSERGHRLKWDSNAIVGWDVPAFAPGENLFAHPKSGSSGEMMAPWALQRFVGGGHREVAAEFFAYLIELCGLQRCGSGRIAQPLTGYLQNEGRCAGFDISGKAIARCREKVSRSHPNFDFEVADIQNLSWALGSDRWLMAVLNASPASWRQTGDSAWRRPVRPGRPPRPLIRRAAAK